jgi:hypothetical protein
MAPSGAHEAGTCGSRQVGLDTGSGEPCWTRTSDPLLSGGTLAIRWTRLSVALILECLANGMTLDDIDESFDRTFPREQVFCVNLIAASRSSPGGAAQPHRRERCDFVALSLLVLRWRERSIASAESNGP